MSHANDDEDYFLPLEDQRVFGAGIRRKRVPFVRSSEHELNTTTPATTTALSSNSGVSIANKYLSIVLPKKDQEEKQTEETHTTNQNNRNVPGASQPAAPEPNNERCEVCNLPVSSSTQPAGDGAEPSSAARPHEASLAHQVCMTHSHPPSHLDRNRHGLRYLSAYGWDPDSRLGLGAPGREGIREPVKGRLKADTVGLGVKLDRPAKDSKSGDGVKAAKVQKLNAKQARKGHFDAKRKGDRLREMFYQNDDVQRYLGGGG
ncbi:hypothetical protein ASPWEDRAFT_26535 [Aspergillus wentii DTO 134E9]|uniref:G-patch domain-containing protein n=1 Tax=Aspergillus wentii DTO 134E9 TaxID=1073089 RepID=A0A1L9RQH2_ASPWE|nr:uncharacterized protein ASPWEDRAFT_26535 [Aspergillus wentii DTO 134E9]OJJ37123.1 hypothetical protein ASPWEDRAFT_26535 [Aspergillus wentii DTO 134E9]